MRTRSTLILLGLLGCTRAGSTSDPLTSSTPGAKPPPATPVAIEITAVTLGDDCGRAGAAAPPADQDAGRVDFDADRASPCQESSMQLAFTGAPSGAAQSIRVKRVELVDGTGRLIGELTSMHPTVWDQNGTYGAWDQSVPANQALSVSYGLTSPDWIKMGKRYDRTYTLKVVLSLGPTDRALQRDVQLIAPARLPAMVDT